MHIVVLVTSKDKMEAERIAHTVVEKRLAACVNIIDGVRSIFTWGEKVDAAEECLLVMKSKELLFGELEQTVREVNSYDVPEIIALPILAGSQPYLDWMDDVTQ